MKKITIHSEFVFIIAIIMLSFSVAMITAADFGVSMIVAPAYILSQKLGFLSFGQSEYVIQGILFILFFILMKPFKPLYFSSFLTGIMYGTVLDIWRKIIPQFNPAVTAPGSMQLTYRIIYLSFGMVITSFSISLFFRTYFYPQVYDFFVKGISKKYNLNRNKFKIIFDVSFLTISCIMTLCLFHKFVGIGIGTIIMTSLNGLLIGLSGKIIDKYFNIVPYFKTLSQKFEIE